jgi:GxxExxY protein
LFWVCWAQACGGGDDLAHQYQKFHAAIAARAAARYLIPTLCELLFSGSCFEILLFVINFRWRKRTVMENQLATKALDICFKIHRKYGPGLFESVYEEVFCHEWVKTGIPFKRQHPVPLIHETIKLECGFRADIILNNKIILEFKSVEAVGNIHLKQVLTYLKLTNIRLGVLINFNVVYLKDGVHRIANNL